VRRAALLLAAWPAFALGATLDITVTGVRNDHGQVRLAVCSRADFLKPHCPWQAAAKAAAGSVTLHIADIPAGTYAIQAFHDENGDGKLNRNFIGIPEEGIGFSNDAPMHFGPPDFAAAAFTVGDAPRQLGFSLRYP
jgi:uncharacterized protein (DUF2141 family)